MDAARILDELMALPPEQRREIALRALESVEEPIDPSLEDAWDAELHRRMQAIESGAEPTFSHEEAMDFIFASLHKKAG